MAKVIRVCTWEECETKIHEIETEHNSLTGMCFRGQSNSEWNLDTTLERQVGGAFRFYEYYKLISIIKPAIETFTGSVWAIPDLKEVAEWTSSYDGLSLNLSFVKDKLAYDYLAYLRHHRFPSPLLDWSCSTYVAAYFAFAHAYRSEHVAIYVFVESPKNIKGRGSGQPGIYGFGPNVKTHKRHFRQQSRYTVCVEYDSSEGWNFVPHQGVFNVGRSDQDLLWKIEIPASERVKVLRFLDQFNLNAFSLIDSEESLMETLAFREIDLKLTGAKGNCQMSAKPCSG